MKNLLIAAILVSVTLSAWAVDYSDPLVEAQLIALELSGELTPPARLTQQILEDLAAICDAYPHLARIRYRPRFSADKIIVGITTQAALQFRDGQYSALDDLNQTYGVIEIKPSLNSSYPYLLLKFSQIYNTVLLSRIYADAVQEGVRYVQPSYAYGDGPTIVPEPPFYTFIDAWGDCPSGCTHHELWPFRVEAGRVSLADYYVAAENGSSTNMGLTPETPLPTIQAAIDRARDGQTIIVLPGLYTGPGNRDIDFLGKAITVRSADPNDQNVVNSTIIDCNGSVAELHRGFYFHNGEDANSILDGLTIRDGHARYGGGISCDYSSPTIRACAFLQNVAREGGALYLDRGANSIIERCTFCQNLADDFGGAIYSLHASPGITDCTFTQNSASDTMYGGGAVCNLYGSATFTGCDFSRNISYNTSGGAIYICNGSGLGYLTVLTDCSFIANVARNGTGGAMVNRFGNLTVDRCIFSGNLAASAGALHSSFGKTMVSNSIFTGNLAIGDNFHTISGSYCGAVYLYGDEPTETCQATLTNCIFTHNSADRAGAIYCTDDVNVTLLNCIIWANLIEDGSEIAISPRTIIDINYCDIQQGWPSIDNPRGTGTINWGPGNIDADPCFVDPGYWDANGTPFDANDDFWVDGDYHLLPDSPCINAGDPNYIPEPNETDLDGNPRIINDRIDIGAYEYQPSLVDLLLDLSDYIDQLNLSAGTANSLKAKLDTAVKKLGDNSDQNDKAAANVLNAFINAIEAQQGKKISPTAADDLITAAQNIIESINNN